MRYNCPIPLTNNSRKNALRTCCEMQSDGDQKHVKKRSMTQLQAMINNFLLKKEFILSKKRNNLNN